MEYRQLALLTTLAAILVSCRPAPLPHRATAPVGTPTAEGRTRTTIVFEKDYGNRGRLIGQMDESPLGCGRSVGFSFHMEPPGSESIPEVAGTGFDDPTPFGSGEPLMSLRDAELTSDPAIVVVYSAKTLAGESVSYLGSVYAEEGSEAVVPITGYESVFYCADGRQPKRRVSVTGSLKGKDLTVALEGPHDTLRFRLELFVDGRFGWYALPGQAKPPGTYYMAPSLPTISPAHATSKP